MTWMETIRISLGRGSGITGDLGILKTLEGELAAVDSLKWEISRNPSVPQDVLIVLRWQGDPPTPPESDIALALVRELKRHGLVDHTVWMNRVEGKDDKQASL